MEKVSGLLQRPEGALCLLVFAHGAGAGMSHPFMEGMARRLAERGVATFRYNFPYMERGGKRPDSAKLLTSTVRLAVATAMSEAGDLPLLAGGKSMGGRMTSLAAAESPLEGVRGLVFFGFPLHPAGRPSTERAEHLSAVDLPMLFLQGTRDSLAPLDLLRPICDQLGSRAKLHVVEGGDHSFRMQRGAERTHDAVLEELAEVVLEWATKIVAGR